MAKKVRAARTQERRKQPAATGKTRVATDVARAGVTAAEAAAPPPDTERVLDGAVDSLRRLLSELLEGRLESVARDLAELRREAAAGAERERLLDLLDDLLQRTGAVRFSARALDVVDPLIHTVVEERSAAGVPRGVIVEPVRPGFRSGRGAVLCKAAVAVSGG